MPVHEPFKAPAAKDQNPVKVVSADDPVKPAPEMLEKDARKAHDAMAYAQNPNQARSKDGGAVSAECPACGYQYRAGSEVPCPACGETKDDLTSGDACPKCGATMKKGQ